MISRLHGILIEKSPLLVVIDINGLGFEVNVPMSTFDHLPDVGQPTTLLTHFVVREDAQVLFGFQSPEERHTFRELIKVSGIGPKIALAILSAMTIDQLSLAIESSDIALLTKVPGIGKKTAERLALELKGKLAPSLNISPSSIGNVNHNDIAQALIALGYSEREATRALKSLPADISVNDGIRQALQFMAK